MKLVCSNCGEVAAAEMPPNCSITLKCHSGTDLGYLNVYSSDDHIMHQHQEMRCPRCDQWTVKLMFTTEEQKIKYVHTALHSQVLAVAVINENIGDWTAYIGPVPGHNHEEEFMLVAKHGDKLKPQLAQVLFPYCARHYKWRD